MIHTEEGVAKVASGRAERPWARRNLGFQPALFEFRDTLTFVSIDIVAWTSHYIYI